MHLPRLRRPAPVVPSHHLIDHAAGGPTSADNATLVCSNDHRNRITEGRHAQLINGHVGWIPPTTIDPLQQPRFNRLHDPESAIMSGTSA